MKDLKKIAAIGGAISLALCWPLAVGHIGERVIQDGVATMNNDFLSSAVVEYDRGYLSSKVMTRYVITDAVLIEQFEQDGLPTSFDVESEVTHGLVNLTSVSKVKNFDELPLTLSTVTQLNGNTSFTFNLDSWNIQSEEQGAVSIAPSELKGDVTVLGELAYQISLPSIQVSLNNGETMELTNLSGQGNGKKEKGYWLGEQAIEIDKLILNAPEQQMPTELDQMKYTFSSDKSAEDTRLNNHHLFSVKKVTSTDVNVEDFLFDFAMKNIDTAAFEGVMGIYQNSPVITEQDIAALLPHVESLFENGFSIGLNKLSMVVDEGQVASSWELNVPEGTKNVTQDPMQILPALTGGTNTFISNKVVEENPSIRANIDELIILEMVEQKEDGYYLDATLQEGNIRFSNGQEVPLISLLLPLFIGAMQ